MGIEGGLTVVTGVNTGTRASLWAWPAVCIPAVFLLRGRRPARTAGLVALVVLSVVGTLSWRTDLSTHQATRVQYDALADEVAAAATSHPGAPVVLWMDPKTRATARGTMTATTVANVISDRYGIFPPWCTPAECAGIAAIADHDPAGAVVEVDGLIAVLLPQPPRWL